MSEKVLTEQDLKVLNKIAEEASGKESMGELLNFLGWEDYAGRIFSINHKKEIERAVILSRQETEKKQVPVVSVEEFANEIEKVRFVKNLPTPLLFRLQGRISKEINIRIKKGLEENQVAKK